MILVNVREIVEHEEVIFVELGDGQGNPFNWGSEQKVSR